MSMSLVYLNTFIFTLLFSVDVGFDVRVGVGVGVGVAVGVKDFILKATHLKLFSLCVLRFHFSYLFYGINDFHHFHILYGASMHQREGRIFVQCGICYFTSILLSTLKLLMNFDILKFDGF